MRTIKFRVWDKAHKDWYNPQHRILIHLNGDIYNSEYDEIHNERLIINQFTGLLDKNGKEIFEGDVVQVWNTLKTKTVPLYDGVIEMIMGTYKIKGFSGHKCEAGIFCEEGSTQDIEIIGNIYEHSDLLITPIN